MLLYLRFISKILESLSISPALPVDVSVATAQFINLPLSSGDGRKTNSDTVIFPSDDNCCDVDVMGMRSKRKRRKTTKKTEKGLYSLIPPCVREAR